MLGPKFGFNAVNHNYRNNDNFVQRSVELEKFYGNIDVPLPESTSTVRCPYCLLLFPSVLDQWEKRDEYQQELSCAIDYLQSLDGLSFQGVKIEVKVLTERLIDDTEVQFWKHLGDKLSFAR